MSDTPDWAEREAERLPCCCPVQVTMNGAVVSSHSIVTQDGHPMCPAFYRPAVAQALRTVAEREYGQGLEDAAVCAEHEDRFNTSHLTIAAKIRALAEKEQRL